MKNNDNQSNLLKSIGVASSAGFTLLTCIGGCIWLGSFFDQHWGTYPWGMLLGGLFGGFGGLYSMYKQLTK